MPTKKPRITVTLEPSTDEIIERYAVLQGRPKSSVLADIIESVAPSMKNTISLLEAASEAPEHMLRGMVDSIEKAHDQLSASAGDTMTQLDWIMANSGKVSGVPDPHIVTRGLGRDSDTRDSGSKSRRRPHGQRGSAK